MMRLSLLLIWKNSSTVTIFGKKYIVFENHYIVEIDENGAHEKVVCAVFTEEELDDWEKSLIVNYGKNNQ